MKDFWLKLAETHGAWLVAVLTVGMLLGWTPWLRETAVDAGWIQSRTRDAANDHQGLREEIARLARSMEAQNENLSQMVQQMKGFVENQRLRNQLDREQWCYTVVKDQTNLRACLKGELPVGR